MVISTPILIILYKRPETTVHLIKALKKVKPKSIYIAINFPPINASSEVFQDYKNVLELIKNINWKCNLKIKKRKKHLKIYASYKGAINWFFKYENEGIVLEDDTIPNRSFFIFCSKLLKKYRYNKKISMICGTSFYNQKAINNESYLFNHIPLMWGFATWRRSIHDLDDKLKDWPVIKKKIFTNFSKNKSFIDHWTKIFSDAYNKKYLSFDYQMFYTNLKNKKLNIIPKINLVKNIGFSKKAEHTKTKEWYSNLETRELKSIKHPKIIEPNLYHDNWIIKYHFKIEESEFLNKIKKNKIFKLKIIFKIGKIFYRAYKYIKRQNKPDL